ncbi:MAG TPA: DUF302 domain-containing protein [Gammaproteobacteria bacterium]|nr:DUF302 domain-containing protein [Gammaproteobacteria bacterium]
MYSFTIHVPGPFPAAVERVVAALKDEGFGVLADIDVQATLKAKLGLERSAYRILGACNPELASQALDADPDIGALLPCNVVVRDDGGAGIGVCFMDPGAVLELAGKPGIDALGREVRTRLQRVARALEHPPA